MNNLKFKNTQGDPEAEIKRALLCSNQKMHRLCGIMEGLGEDEIDSFKGSLTPSQDEFIFQYCRKILTFLIRRLLFVIKWRPSFVDKQC